ncbi:uncharacterized protein PRCAT00002011001 [Priceomyces carsonii]|uniref:uncharacterized protein n=1 Tax=Priceomyces carsonii TaxID=28549 RepID=UPI002ED79BB7|nr:unnamed protein product [Priceomyces carsonii]
MATQLRLRSAKVLLINLGGVGSEIIKNLVLGGLNSIEILDGSVVKAEDFATQFFLPNSDDIIGKLKLPIIEPKIKELNNRVNLTINTNLLEEVFENPSYLEQFELIIATELSKAEIIKLNECSRSLGIPLYVAGIHGMFGYIMTDLISNTAKTEKETGNQPRKPNTKLSKRKTITSVDIIEEGKKELVTIFDEFVPMESIMNSRELPSQLNKRQMKRLSAALPLIFSLFEFNRPSDPELILDKTKLKSISLNVCDKLNIPSTVINEEYLDLFCRQAFAEFSPVAAILGGCLSQDVIQFLSGKESPINNVVILDSIRSDMSIYVL